jgi:hypothetical protein
VQRECCGDCGIERVAAEFEHAHAGLCHNLVRGGNDTEAERYRDAW